LSAATPPTALLTASRGRSMTTPIRTTTTIRMTTKIAIRRRIASEIRRRRRTSRRSYPEHVQP
jgi:hypothetical protein